jgi:phosphoribosylglycinamide formyltransferase-1
VIAQSPSAYGIFRARRAGVPVEIFPEKIRESKDRNSSETWILDTLKKYRIKNLFLAGFMRIISGDFISQFESEFGGAIYNIHPSLLPKHKGLNAFEEALKAEDQWLGGTIHRVVQDVDAGPIVLQRAYKSHPSKLLLHVHEQIAIRQSARIWSGGRT